MSQPTVDHEPADFVVAKAAKFRNYQRSRDSILLFFALISNVYSSHERTRIRALGRSVPGLRRKASWATLAVVIGLKKMAIGGQTVWF